MKHLSDLNEVADLAAEYRRQGDLRAVVGVGGDGTVGELVNRTEPGVPITMLSTGTMNLLARYVGMAASPEDVARTIAEGAVVQLDAGRAGGRLFTLVMSCGFDADVVRRLHRRRSGHIGIHSYFPPLVASIRHYRFPELRIHWDDPEEAALAGSTSSARWFLAFNLPCYAGWPPIAPAAVGNDGLLDACTFARGSFWHGLRYVAAVLCRRATRLADYSVRRIRRATITAADEVPYELDGDPGGVLPVEVEVVPGRLTLLVPRESASSFGGLTGCERSDILEGPRVGQPWPR